MACYVALLRGINVGGNNVIRMEDLRGSFEVMGFQDVRTYIQSGNVVFRAAEADPARLAGKIERALSAGFDYDSRAVVRSHGELERIVSDAPRGFGGDDLHRYNVVFLKEPATVDEAMANVRIRDGVDEARAGQGVLYFSTLKSAASRSGLTRVIGTPIYRLMTIRNWNTTVKLKDLTADC
jgi:uncharacterized protein (DUF1697 family)